MSARRPVAIAIAMLCAMAVAACASVLGFPRTGSSHAFEHRAHVDKGINCVVCHEGVDRAGETGPLHLPSDAQCRGCHAKPHNEASCRGCHGEASMREGAGFARERLRFEHAKHDPVVHGDCVRCHSAVAESRPQTLLPQMAVCFSCHQHQDQWNLRSCDACHVDLAADDTPPASHVVHDGDWIREHGVRAGSERDLCSTCHSERSCAKCHGAGTAPTLPAKMAFDDVPLAGLHRAGFRSRHALEARADPGLCSTCHSESSCIDCHTASHVSPQGTTRSPHALGWVSAGRGGGEHGVQARIDPVSCAGCHGGAGEMLCVGCHSVGGPGGNPHGPGFTSNKNRTHDVPCRLCHGTGP